MEFYKELDSAKAKGDVDSWLKNVLIPKLNSAAEEALNAAITTDEVTDSIKSFSTGKAPRPDGFGPEFYQKFSRQISPLLLRMLSHSSDIERLPPTLYNANIALILKPDRDDTNPASYCPISMLSMDFRIFTKILANRLKQQIELLIHKDQTGFIPNRYSFFNTRRQ